MTTSSAFYTYSSNFTALLEALLMDDLANLLQAQKQQPLSEAALFDPIKIVVDTPAIEEHLRQQIAKRFSTSTPVQFLTMGQWMAQWPRDRYTQDMLTSTQWMIWQILTQTDFRQTQAQNRLELTQTSLSPSVAYFELAGNIAKQFMKYLNYRLDWVLSWLEQNPETCKIIFGQPHDAKALWFQERHIHKSVRNHEDYGWQKALWQQLIVTNPDGDMAVMIKQLLRNVGLVHDEAPRHETQTLFFFMPTLFPATVLPYLKSQLQKRNRQPIDVKLYMLSAMLPNEEHGLTALASTQDDPMLAVEDPLMQAKATHGEDSPLPAYPGFDDTHADSAPNPLIQSNAHSTRAILKRIRRFVMPDTEGDVSTQPGLFSTLQPAVMTLDTDHDTHPDASSLAWGDLSHATKQQALRQKLHDYFGELALNVNTRDNPVFVMRRGLKLLDAISRALALNTPELFTHTFTPLGSKVSAQETLTYTPDVNDDSVMIVRAPSVRREVESIIDIVQSFLHDKDASKRLRPENIVVAMPNLQARRATLEAAMLALPEALRFPYRFLGEGTRQADPVFEAFTQLMRWGYERISLASFSQWLSMPLVVQKYGLDLKSVQTMIDWLKEAGFRFGVSPELLVTQCPSFVDDQDMTLSQAVDRLLFARVMGGQATPQYGLLPVEKGSGFEKVSELPEVLDTLVVMTHDLMRWSQNFYESKTIQAWQATCFDTLNELCLGTSLSRKLVRQGLTDVLMNLSSALGDEASQSSLVEPALLVASLTAKASFSPTPGGSTKDAVIFGDLASVRGLSRDVVIIMGLDRESRFPEVIRPMAFDLMDKEARYGDRDKEKDQRNMFLDTMTQAQTHLILSYVEGAKLTPMPPSPILDEILGWLDRQFTQFDKTLPKFYEVKVGLSSTDLQRFTPTSGRLQTRNRTWLAAAMANFSPSQPHTFVNGPWPQRVPEIVQANTLAAWLDKPLDMAFKQWQVTEPESLDTPSLVDMLHPKDDGLVAYDLRMRGFNAVMQEKNPDQEFAAVLLDPNLGAKVWREDYRGVFDQGVLFAQTWQQLLATLPAGCQQEVRDVCLHVDRHALMQVAHNPQLVNDIEWVHQAILPPNHGRASQDVITLQGKLNVWVSADQKLYAHFYAMSKHDPQYMYRKRVLEGFIPLMIAASQGMVFEEVNMLYLDKNHLPTTWTMKGSDPEYCNDFGSDPCRQGLLATLAVYVDQFVELSALGQWSSTQTYINNKVDANYKGKSKDFDKAKKDWINQGLTQAQIEDLNQRYQSIQGNKAKKATPGPSTFFKRFIFA